MLSNIKNIHFLSHRFSASGSQAQLICVLSSVSQKTIIRGLMTQSSLLDLGVLLQAYWGCWQTSAFCGWVCSCCRFFFSVRGLSLFLECHPRGHFCVLENVYSSLPSNLSRPLTTQQMTNSKPTRNIIIKEDTAHCLPHTQFIPPIYSSYPQSRKDTQTLRNGDYLTACPWNAIFLLWRLLPSQGNKES